MTGQTGTEARLEMAERPVGSALFVSETDRSFSVNELQMTPLRDFHTCPSLLVAMMLFAAVIFLGVTTGSVILDCSQTPMYSSQPQQYPGDLRNQ
ncbi:hypothetical protein L596_030359 [Steinernema carpocapsae]|uniref:Uncharacterized protein n=1 Tax=Steinernema carpocapsae TaxID=34508 RepID=A0A4U5LP67_STECR|nr:hypothetical protein L596_030359 [Steinernema carpocapsae]